MENFNQDFNSNPRPVNEKEKSVYLLHLDKARIVILSAIVLSVIGITFLIGMKFTSGEDLPKDAFADTRPTLNDGSNQNIDDLFDKEAKVTAEATTAEPVKDAKDLVKNDSVKTDKKDDILSNNTADKIIEPAGEDKQLADRSLPVPAKSNVKKSVASKSSKKSPAAHVVKVEKVDKKHKKSITKNSSNEVIPVSVTLPKPKKGSFAIQVVSYDLMNKAKKESDSLKTMEYDTYIDKTQVNGRTYFRVRIGPFETKNAANDLLTKLQENSKYSESYIVME